MHRVRLIAAGAYRRRTISKGSAQSPAANLRSRFVTSTARASATRLCTSARWRLSPQRRSTCRAPASSGANFVIDGGMTRKMIYAE